MGRSAPMNRLLQGDVGCGKTLVAAAAIVLAARGGVQSALMAPTEILAAQHAQKLAPLLLPFGIAVEAVFGSCRRARARETRATRIASGEATLAVGTHALIDRETSSSQRWGSRSSTNSTASASSSAPRCAPKSRAPHTLHMTATPIPRTLAQTRYADLDLSVIDELPPGRTPIETYVIRESRRPIVYEFVRKNVGARTASLRRRPGDRRIRRKRAARARSTKPKRVARDVWPGFGSRCCTAACRRAKRTRRWGVSCGGDRRLMATTVVEVGVDIPNASVMVILDAHRYGLAQLHQLRGRVGRGDGALVLRRWLPPTTSETRAPGDSRRTEDGFRIAEEDLRLRGPGIWPEPRKPAPATHLGDIVEDFAVYMRGQGRGGPIVVGPIRRWTPDPDHRALRALVRRDAGRDARCSMNRMKRIAVGFDLDHTLAIDNKLERRSRCQMLAKELGVRSGANDTARPRADRQDVAADASGEPRSRPHDRRGSCIRRTGRSRKRRRTERFERASSRSCRSTSKRCPELQAMLGCAADERHTACDLDERLEPAPGRESADDRVPRAGIRQRAIGVRSRSARHSNCLSRHFVAPAATFGTSATTRPSIARARAPPASRPFGSIGRAKTYPQDSSRPTSSSTRSPNCPDRSKVRLEV